jgi:hypothetical protein
MQFFPAKKGPCTISSGFFFCCHSAKIRHQKKTLIGILIRIGDFILFFQFCDIENLANDSRKIAKLLEIKE